MKISFNDPRFDHSSLALRPMFRSPNDASSSESSSDASSDDEIEISRIPTNKSFADSGGSAALPQHANLITASLLEFHATVRAAEILNVANPGTRYDRHSPEAKAFAKKLFADRSQSLASHGMLAEDLHKDELKEVRQQYLTGIDSLGIAEALGNAAASPPILRPSLEAGALSDPMSTLLVDSKHLHTRRLPGVSRYATEFLEVRQLGKGGFGTVYHVVNFVDNQHYAIKKISIDPKRLKQRWQEGGQEEIENVLREIRTLASLEHSNIVRYFGAWIEGSTGSPSRLTQLEGSQSPIFRRVLGDVPSEVGPSESARFHSQSSTKLLRDAHQNVTKFEADSACNADGIIFSEDSFQGQPLNGPSEDDALASTVSLSNETDIFTDGDGRGRRMEPDLSPNRITLCLQMSLHQLNLANYLSPHPSTAPSPESLHELPHTRHCFHLKPSLSIFVSILSGVQYLHSAGIVHRDLKPANIFLSEDSVLRPGFVDASCLACPQQSSRFLNTRIGDFGLVGNVAEELSASACTPNKVVGTEFYRPPPFPVSGELQDLESHGNGKGKGLATARNTVSTRIDEKIDVFALGVLLFELLWRFDTKAERFVVLNALTRSGTLPAEFSGMFAHSTVDAAAGREQRQQHSEPGNMVAECIAGMVHSDPAERWDCARVEACIERVLRMC